MSNRKRKYYSNITIIDLWAELFPLKFIQKLARGINFLFQRTKCWAGLFLGYPGRILNFFLRNRARDFFLNTTLSSRAYRLFLILFSLFISSALNYLLMAQLKDEHLIKSETESFYSMTRFSGVKVSGLIKLYVLLRLWTYFKSKERIIPRLTHHALH